MNNKAKIIKLAELSVKIVILLFGILILYKKLIINQIKTKIYNIRGLNVLVDRDLANIYGIETKRLLEQVRRNIERFPERYVFQMNE